MVWFRGQPRGTGQIKFSLKFQASHGSPGEGHVPKSTTRPGEVVQGASRGPYQTASEGLPSCSRLFFGEHWCMLGDRRGDQERMPCSDGFQSPLVLGEHPVVMETPKAGNMGPMRKQGLGEVRLRDHFLEEVTLMLEGGEGIPSRGFSKSHAAKAGQATHS